MSEKGGFWKKFSDKISKSKDPVKDLEQIFKDMRAYERFNVWELGVTRITIENRTDNIRDVSFSGVSARMGDPAFLATIPLNVQIDGTIDLLGHTFPMHLICVRKVGDVAGFRFNHDLPDSLVKLSSFLEHLRSGATMQEIDKKNVKEKYQSPEWVALRGEGPVDLLINKANNAGGFIDAVLSFPKGEHYQEITWTQGVVKTGRTMDLEGPGSRMEQSMNVDLNTLRQGIEIFHGITNQSWRDYFSQGLLTPAMGALGLK